MTMKTTLSKFLFWTYAAVFGLGLFLALTGCSSPAKKAARDLAKVQAVQTAQAVNEGKAVAAARGQVYAVAKTLARETNQSAVVALAAEFNDHALLTLGVPDFNEADFYRRQIDSLLSTNAVLQASARTALAEKDGTIVSLQSERDALQAKLVTAEKKEAKDYIEAAGYAGHWLTIKHILWWGAIILAVLFLLRVASDVLPPPYNSVPLIVDHVVGSIAGWCMAAFPKAKAAAGVVESEAVKLGKAAEAKLAPSQPTVPPAANP